MFSDLDIFGTAAALARHAGQQQALIAANVANADTPGYRATRLPDFAATLADAPELRRTRAGHLGAPETDSALRPVDAGGEPSPNGNSVSIETEMFAAARAQQVHARAMMVWRHAIGVLRSSLGR